MKLVDKPYGAIAQIAARFLAQLVNILAVDEDMPGRRLVQPAQQLQQRGLARSGGTHDGETLSGTHFEVDTLQDIERDRSLPEALVDITCLENDFGHTSSLVSQSVRGRGARGPPGWIDRGEDAQQKSHRADLHHVPRLDVRGQLVHEIDARVHELHAEQMLDAIDDLLQMM